MIIRALLIECSSSNIELDLESGVRAGRILSITEDDLMKKTWDKYPGGHDALSKDIRHLWKNPMIKRILCENFNMNILENAKFFLDATHRVFRPTYTANEDDYIRDYVVTTGINKIDLLVEGNAVVLYDVGGKRSERKKVFLFILFLNL
jgi:hypothetical protein